MPRSVQIVLSGMAPDPKSESRGGREDTLDQAARDMLDSFLRDVQALGYDLGVGVVEFDDWTWPEDAQEGVEAPAEEE